jgi:UDP-N-acetylmuramate-alanine ligase
MQLLPILIVSIWDFYKSMNDLKNYFSRFVNKVPSFGKSFICSDDKINNELIKSLKNKIFIHMVKKMALI